MEIDEGKTILEIKKDKKKYNLWTEERERRRKNFIDNALWEKKKKFENKKEFNNIKNILKFSSDEEEEEEEEEQQQIKPIKKNKIKYESNNNNNELMEYINKKFENIILSNDKINNRVEKLYQIKKNKLLNNNNKPVIINQTTSNEKDKLQAAMLWQILNNR